MSSINDVSPVISFSKNDITTDITGQLAVSQRNVVQSYIFSQTDHQLFISRQTSGGATVSLDTGIAALVLTLPTTSGAKAAVETKKVVQYLVGQGHTISTSLTIGAALTNRRKRWGVFSDANGLFFQQTGTNFSVVSRSNVTGSIVDTVVNQTDFNLDKGDGTGPSGFNLDVTKNAVYLIEYTWHGAGRVRFGVKAEKENVYFHEFNFDNSAAYSYNRNPYQPMKVEIENTGTAASTGSLYLHALANWVHNAQRETPNIIFSASRGASVKGMVSSAYRPLLAIRPALQFNSRINRVNVEPIATQVYAAGQALHCQVILNPTTITGASWSSVNATSAVEFDISATAYTGGTVINEFYVSANTDLISGSSPGASVSQIGSFPLGLSIDGNSQDVLMLVARTLSGSNDAAAAISWKEFQ